MLDIYIVSKIRKLNLKKKKRRVTQTQMARDIFAMSLCNGRNYIFPDCMEFPSFLRSGKVTTNSRRHLFFATELRGIPGPTLELSN